MNIRNDVFNTWNWLAFAGVILTGLRATTAAEDSEKSPPATLTVAAAADLKFALDDLVKECFQLQDLAARYPHQLSGGQKQCAFGELALQENDSVLAMIKATNVHLISRST